MTSLTPPSLSESSNLIVEFCGEEFVLEPGTSFDVGRDAALVVDDDNHYLHRRLVEFTHDVGFWWIANVGTRLGVTVSGEIGSLVSWLGPGSRLPIVLPELEVLFSAGGTTYQLGVRASLATFERRPDQPDDAGDMTLGAVELTPSQFRMMLALAERSLLRVGTGAAALPSNADAARRLGWATTKFNRKLDNVCDKYARAGVQGLRGDSTKLATSRRARLVEYAVAARIVRRDHLALLDEPEIGEMP